GRARASSASTRSAWSACSARGSRFRSAPSSAAWAWPRPRPPAASAAARPASPPGVHAGNLDNKELVAGTTLFIPVHVRGALFAVGDGHAAQGDGEVCITGLETSLAGTLQFVVRKDLRLKWPRAETPTHHIVMGLDKDLTEAMRLATRETIDFL